MVQLQLLLVATLSIIAAAVDDVDRYSWKTVSKAGEAVEIIVGVNATSLLRYASIKFDRKLCRPADSLEISGSPETTDFLHRTTGPDEILLSVEGPSIQMFILQPSDCNAYLTSFRIPVAGNYRVKLVSQRNNYAAVNEISDIHPPIEYDKLLDVPLYLSKTPSNPSITCKGYWIHKTPELSLQNETFHLGKGEFTRGNLPMSTFTSVGSNPVTEVIDEKSYACAENSDNYEWILSDCSDPEKQLLNSTEVAEHLAGKRIHLIGDSHMRTFLFNIFDWACGSGFERERTTSLEHSVPLSATRCPGLFLTYTADFLCLGENLPKHGPFDLVMMNCGHHTASTSDKHFPIESYRKAVTKLADNAVLKGYNSSNFVWIESVPLPVRSDHHVITYKDWRTYQRLSIFNTCANQIMRRSSVKGKSGVTHAGFNVIPSFDSLMPFSDKFCDNAHYTSPGASVPQYQEFIRLLRSQKS